MQVLYQVENGDPSAEINTAKILENRLDQTPGLFTYMIYFLTEVAHYAEKDANIKAAKHLATTQDKNINTKLAANDLIWKILENHSYKQAITKYKFAFENTGALVRQIFHELISTDIYKQYIQQQSRDVKNEKEILFFIFSDLMLPNEDFIAHIEEHFTNWDDDAEMIVVLMSGFLQKPSSLNLQQMPDAEKKNICKRVVANGNQ